MDRKGAIIFLVWMLIIFVSIISATMEEQDISLNPNDYARITDVDYKAVVEDEPTTGGKALITERLTFDVHATSHTNPFWELWRDLPESYTDGLKTDYDVKYVKELQENGEYINYARSPQLYWEDYDYISPVLGPNKWYHSKGPYNESERRYECLMMYIDGWYRKIATFEIQYEMNNAAFKYKDCSELYLTMYSEETCKYLQSFKGQILLASKDMPSKGNYEAHTYGTNAHEFPFVESDTLNKGYHTFAFDLHKEDLQFKPYNEYIEFDLIAFGDDCHKFTDYAPRNKYTDDNALKELRQEQKAYENLPAKYTVIKFVVLLLCGVGSIYVLKYPLNIDEKMNKKYNFYEPTMEMEYFREIPSDLDPSFAAALVFCKHKMPKDDANGYSAIMLSLVRKGYIELQKINDQRDWTFKNVKIVVKFKPAPVFDEFEGFHKEEEEERKKFEPLSRTEELYFELITRYTLDGEIAMSTFQKRVTEDYENTNTFITRMKAAIEFVGVNENYVQKLKYTEPKSELKRMAFIFGFSGILITILVNYLSSRTRLELAYGGFFLLGISCFATATWLYHVSKNYILLTQYGEDEYVKWRGLYNFLNSETLMNERTVLELPLWEKYLVYATAFGISDKVIKALNIRCKELDIQASPMLKNPYYRSSSFHHTCSHHFRTATHTAMNTARYGGGYYGGGGRGGGGGGGGH